MRDAERIRELLEQLERECGDRRITRDTVARTYAGLIRAGLRAGDEARRANRAIMNRWSVSALSYVKREAWRRVQTRGGIS